MTLPQNLRVAFRALLSNKLRAALTMLGVIIGVASVIALVSVGDGAQARVEGQISALGTNLLQVQALPPRIAGVAQQRGASANLTVDDVAPLRTLKGVARVAPEMSRGFQVVYQRQNTNVQVVGTTEDYPEIRKAAVAAGRFISSLDVDDGSLVAVLGDSAASDLFGAEEPVGKTIQINTTTVDSGSSGVRAVVTPVDFKVVGVMQAKGVGFDSPDDTIFVPVSTAQWRLVGSANLRWIDVEATSPDEMNDAADAITLSLNQRHGITNPAESPYIVRNQADILSTVQGVSQTFTLLLGAIAAISLVVGGIGIMNIMMVSVTERTREIGLRKALGATRGLILQQFLIEAVALSLLGGLIGIASGSGTAQALGSLAGWSTLVSVRAVALAFSSALAMGLLFGVYPAWRAARLDPIEALRYE
ncbi:MAG: ABC transporter permease [Chloroflexota bacterium]|nr:ABC transporter permease [Chloroflexota bacterium]